MSLRGVVLLLGVLMRRAAQVGGWLLVAVFYAAVLALFLVTTLAHGSPICTPRGGCLPDDGRPATSTTTTAPATTTTTSTTTTLATTTTTSTTTTTTSTTTTTTLALACTSLTHDWAGTGVPSATFNTASVSPTANDDIMVAVQTACQGTCPPTAPTISGTSLSFGSPVVSQVFDSNAQRIDLFHAHAASPGTGALTFTYAAAENSIAWAVFDCSPVHTIVQTASTSFASSSTLSVPLSAFAAPTNLGISFVGANGGGFNTDITAGTGWTLLFTPATHNTSTFLTTDDVMTKTNGTDPNATTSVARACAILAVELGP